MASLGSLPLLLLPPALLLLFMWFEREYLVVIYHDMYVAMDGMWSNFVWQALSPLLLFSIWAAFLRPPIFSDLPRWPGAAPLLGACLFANTPILVYVARSSMQFRGPAHWFSGGVVIWACGQEPFAYY